MRYSWLEETDISEAILLKDIVSGKTVLEVGAGAGKFAEALSSFCDITCVEMEPVYADACRMKGLKIIERDFVDVIPNGFDVIFAYLSFGGNYALTRWIEKNNWHGIVISRYYPLHTDPSKPIQPKEIVHASLPYLIYEI